MSFLDTVRVGVKLNGEQQHVAAYVGKGADETVILGTDALQAFNLRLEMT